MSYSSASNRTSRRAQSLGEAAKSVAAWLSRHLWLVLPLLAIPALWPFANLSLPVSADGTLHLLRLAALDHHVRQGMLYPRWLPELFAGLGYPVLNFYGPLTYYLAELLHLIGLDFVSALIAAFAVLVLAGGFGMYWLARDVLGPQQHWAALVAETAYMYAPYSTQQFVYPGRGSRRWRAGLAAVGFLEHEASADCPSAVSVRAACGSQPVRAGRHTQHHFVVHTVCAGRLCCGSLVAGRPLARPAGLDSICHHCGCGSQRVFLAAPHR